MMIMNGQTLEDVRLGQEVKSGDAKAVLGSISSTCLTTIQSPTGATLLMKLTPVVNFINILQAAFALIFFCQKITEPNCS